MSQKAAAAGITDWQPTGPVLNEKLTSNKLNNQGGGEQEQQTGGTEAWEIWIGPEEPA